MKNGPTLVGEFVARLTAATKADKVIWHSEILNIYSCFYEDFKIWTDWERDEPPQLSVNDAYFHGDSYGIETLWESIREQFRRQERYRLSGATGILPKEPATLDQEGEVLTEIGRFLRKKKK